MAWSEGSRQAIRPNGVFSFFFEMSVTSSGSFQVRSLKRPEVKPTRGHRNATLASSLCLGCSPACRGAGPEGFQPNIVAAG